MGLYTQASNSSRTRGAVMFSTRSLSVTGYLCWNRYLHSPQHLLWPHAKLQQHPGLICSTSQGPGPCGCEYKQYDEA